MSTNTNTDTNHLPRRWWGLCEYSLNAIRWALYVNKHNGKEVGFRLIEDNWGTGLETDSPDDALDAAEHIRVFERESERAGDERDADDMRRDIHRIIRVTQFWAQARGGDA